MPVLAHNDEVVSIVFMCFMYQCVCAKINWGGMHKTHVVSVISFDKQDDTVCDGINRINPIQLIANRRTRFDFTEIIMENLCKSVNFMQTLFNFFKSFSIRDFFLCGLCVTFASFFGRLLCQCLLWTSPGNFLSFFPGYALCTHLSHIPVLRETIYYYDDCDKRTTSKLKFSLVRAFISA